MKQLKVAAARQAGLDTTADFRRQHASNQQHLLSEYRHQLLPPSQELWHRKRTGFRQILRRLLQHISKVRLESEIRRMDSLYQAIQANPQVPFSQWVHKYSDDTCRQLVDSLQTTVEIGRVLSSAKQGTVSPPFLSPEGIHILQIDEQEETSGTGKSRRSLSDVLDQLKAELHYLPNPLAMDEVRQTGHTQQTLFTIDGKPYTGELFDLFASAHPQTIARQLDAFVSKSLFDAWYSYLQYRSPEFRAALQAADERDLIAGITQIRVEQPATHDLDGQAAYLRRHIKDYHLPKKAAKRIKKRIKRLPAGQWPEALRENLPAEEAQTVTKQVQKDYRALLNARWELELEEEAGSGKDRHRF
ncbi:MAG: peptidyl-prolyl cis-trans isomerase [Mediterranea sp.]|nr:peptidyl-prolyl cis-trans isomerase [Mediterranea sp.]